MHKPNRWTLTAGLLIALVAAGCSASHSAHATTTTIAAPTITGTFSLVGTKDTTGAVNEADPTALGVEGDYTDLGTLGCAGTNGYDDIEAGLQVQVSDERDTVIGTGELSLGKVTDTGCDFTFIVPDLPVAKFYKITVGRRGELDYSYADLQAAGWHVGFTLGS